MTTANWNFVYAHENADVTQLLLKKKQYPEVDMVWAVRQIEARQKAKKKLPSWYSKEKIIFPARVSVEQSSSEATANFKASLFKGENMIDLTGGFGVDVFYFANRFKNAIYCEQNKELANIVLNNAKVFNYKNIKFHCGDGLQHLKENEQFFDLIYLDPARRDGHNKKVVFLEDCQPNVVEHLVFLLAKTKQLLIKTSPMLDIPQAIKQLQFVQQVWVVAVGNEVKEVLFEIGHEVNQTPRITAAMINANDPQTFTEDLMSLKPEITFTPPKAYLYEPHAVILKAGLQDVLAKKMQLEKLHPNSQLYTSTENKVGFFGRIFQIEKILSLNKKQIKKAIPDLKANITVRNFPLNVAAIRKKIGLQEGGDIYIFATTLLNGQKVLLQCRKT